MAFKKHYNGAIWTNHALQRLGQRGLTQEMAGQTFRSPDSTLPAKNGGVEYRKQYGVSSVTVIAKRNEKREWIILSCWIDPPMPGSIDIQKKKDYMRYKHASFLGRVWITIKRQIIPRKY